MLKLIAVQSLKKKLVSIHTSHSSPHRQGAGRCTAYMRCPSRFHPLSSVSPQRHTGLQCNAIQNKHLVWGQKSSAKPFASLPLESKWHCRGAAEPPLACRRIPAAASTKCTPLGFILLCSGQPGLVPLWSPVSFIYTSCCYTDAPSEVASGTTITWPSGLAEGVGEPCHLLWNEEVLIYRRWSGWNLVSWQCYGRAGDHLATLQWAWTPCDTNNDICNAVTKRERVGREERRSTGQQQTL